MPQQQEIDPQTGKPKHPNTIRLEKLEQEKEALRTEVDELKKKVEQLSQHPEPEEGTW